MPRKPLIYPPSQIEVASPKEFCQMPSFCGNVTTNGGRVSDMTITTLSGRELNQDLGKAKRAANEGPVIITDRGKPTHVLVSFEEYKRLSGKQQTLGELLASPEPEDFDLPLPERNERARPVDLS